MCFDNLCSKRNEIYKLHPMTALCKKSDILKAGNGLFADRMYKKNEFITYYSGTYTNDSDKTGDRLLWFNTWGVIGNGKCRNKKSRGDLINHSKDNPNCDCKCDTSHNKNLKLVKVLALRDIQQGEEFFWNYGKDFKFE